MAVLVIMKLPKDHTSRNDNSSHTREVLFVSYLGFPMDFGLF